MRMLVMVVVISYSLYAPQFATLSAYASSEHSGSSCVMACRTERLELDRASRLSSAPASEVQSCLALDPWEFDSSMCEARRADEELRQNCY
ncbi:hypothetical protein CPB85DRAFT_1278951 [Mucidula mucida]|nr:hypothetical protein CPB85DRAFT_1278951 [Mucidula mucida]